MPISSSSRCGRRMLLMLMTMAFIFSMALIAPLQSQGATDEGDADAGSPARQETVAPQAMIDGSGPGFRLLTAGDFVNVNCNPDTWTWKEGTAYCTGKPTGVIRGKKLLTNFELSCQWRHMRDAGNSGIFIWGTEASIERLAKASKPGLPGGIEVQVLDLGYAAHYEKQYKKPSDWFTSHGDVFPVGEAKLTPFPPVAPNGRRSFPSKNLSLGVGEWNHYYIRAINGEVRLWVNGEEVSGGTDAQPRTGYLCLESEGSPVEFKELRLRELP